MKLLVRCIVQSGRVDKKRVVRLAQRLFREFRDNRKFKRSIPIKEDLSHLSIVFADARVVRKLNKMYRGKDQATDVLSFGTDTAGIGVGEIVVCPAVIVRQAREHGISAKKELDYLLIHGFLHLLGYDHEKSRRQAQVMFRLQDKLFDRLSED